MLAGRALRADATVFSEVGADESKTSSAAAVVALIGFISGLLRGIFTAETGVLSTAIGGLIGAFVLWYVGTGLFYALARFFGGEGRFEALLRGNAYAAVPFVLGGYWDSAMDLVVLWSLYLFVLNVRENMSLSGAAALAVVVIPVGAFVGLAWL